MNVKRPLLMLMTLYSWHNLHGAPFIYVGDTNDDFVYVIDAATNKVLTSINMGAESSGGVAITPNNSTVFVACQDMTVKRINVATNAHILPDISVAPATPQFVAITPDGLYAYVTCSDGTVKRINIATNSIDVVITGFNNPKYITIAPNGLTAYVGNNGTSGVIPIDIATNTLGTPVSGAPITSAFSIAVDPSSSYAYVANDNAGNVIQLNLSNRLAPTVSNTITLSGFIVGVVVTPDGNYLYATNLTGNSLTPINISTPASPMVGTPVTMGIGPGPSLVINSNGSYAYIPNISDNSVTPVNIINRAVPVAATDITVGNGPAGIAITSVNAPTNVSGIVAKNIFLDKTELVLVITWTPVSFDAIAYAVAYNIYQGTVLVKTVSANCPPVAGVYLKSCNNKNSYLISTVYSDGTESMHIPVKVS